jgi:hypothetical protein
VQDGVHASQGINQAGGRPKVQPDMLDAAALYRAARGADDCPDVVTAPHGLVNDETPEEAARASDQ